MLRSLLGSDTSCCDLLQSGLPRIPALPHPLKPCSYQDDQAQSYASGRPGLYNGCVVCRVVLARPGWTTRPSLCFAPPLSLSCVGPRYKCEYDCPRGDAHTMPICTCNSPVLGEPASIIRSGLT